MNNVLPLLSHYYRNKFERPQNNNRCGGMKRVVAIRRNGVKKTVGKSFTDNWKVTTAVAETLNVSPRCTH